MGRCLKLCAVCVWLSFVVPSNAQSLGDLARQERARRGDNPRSAHVYTNEDISKPSAPPSERQPDASNGNKPLLGPDSFNTTADELRTTIRTQKQKIRDTESQIAAIQKRLDERESVGNVNVSQRIFTLGAGPGTCAVSSAMTSQPYKDWCDEPAKWSAEIEKHNADLAKMRAALSELQERARRMGYGNGVYDPE